MYIFQGVLFRAFSQILQHFLIVLMCLLIIYSTWLPAQNLPSRFIYQYLFKFKSTKQSVPAHTEIKIWHIVAKKFILQMHCISIRPYFVLYICVFYFRYFISNSTAVIRPSTALWFIDIIWQYLLCQIVTRYSSNERKKPSGRAKTYQKCREVLLLNSSIRWISTTWLYFTYHICWSFGNANKHS